MTRLANVRDVGSGITLMLVGLIVLAGSLRMPIGSLAQPDDGFMPMLAGSAITVLSARLTWRGLRCPAPGSRHQPFWPEARSGLRVLCVVGAMLTYALAFEWMGFAPVTFALFLFLLRTIDPVPIKTAVLTSLLVIAGCFLLFQVWLQVQLPAGWLSGWRIGSWIF